MKKALIVTWEKFQDHEVIYPYYRLKEARFDVHIMSNVKGKIFGILGTNMDSDRLLSELADPKTYQKCMNEYDFLVIPGGVKALEKLRQFQPVLNFINEWNEKDKIIASTCHGAQLLISARVVRGRNISGYYSIKDDIENAGAKYINAPAVVNLNIISSPHYMYMGEWMGAALKVYGDRLLEQKKEAE